MRSKRSISSLAELAHAYWVYVLLLGAAFFTLIQVLPMVNITPDVDSGLFMYFGSRILKGDIPYRDLWDNKPPGIFYLNALGFLLGGGTRWGIWAIEFVSLIVALWAGYTFLKQSFGKLAAALSLILVTLHLALILEGGNLPEEYGLPLQFITWICWAAAIRAPRRFWPGFGMGLSMGLAASLKPTIALSLVAPILVLLAVILAKRSSRSWGSLIGIVTGLVLVFGVWAAILAASGVIGDFWRAVVEFNTQFVQVTTTQRLAALKFAFLFLPTQSAFFSMALLAWLVAFAWITLGNASVRSVIFHPAFSIGIFFMGGVILYNALFRNGLVLYDFSTLSRYRLVLLVLGSSTVIVAGLWAQGRLPYILADAVQRSTLDNANIPSSVIVLGLIDLVIHTGVVSATGLQFPHYLISLVPAISLLAAFAFSSFQYVPLTKLWRIILIIPLAWPGLQKTLILSRPHENDGLETVVRYLKASVVGDTPILSWGWNTRLYYLSDHPAPSRYVHQNPLLVKGYVQESEVDQFLSDIRVATPGAVIIGPPFILPFAYPPNGEGCERLESEGYVADLVAQGAYLSYPQEFEITPAMRRVYTWICENYTPIEVPSFSDWQILVPRQVQ